MDRVSRQVNIENLIEKLTIHGNEELPRDYLLSLKLYCKAERTNNEVFKYLRRLLFHRLSQNHSQIRYSAFQIIDYLFQRSHLFRTILCQNFDSLFEYCLGIKKITDNVKREIDLTGLHNLSLQPKTWTKKLQAKFLDRFQCWGNEFGRGYPNLKQIHQFLSIKGLYQSINNSPSTSSRSLTDNSSNTREHSFPNVTIKQTLDQFDELENDINLLVIQIDSCFELLIPKINLTEETMKNQNSSENLKNFRPMQGLSFNIILAPKIEIISDTSNNSILENLKKLCKELNIFGQKLEQFERKSFRIINRMSDEYKNRIKTLKMKIETILCKEKEIKIIHQKSELDLKNNDDDDDSDDDFEEVTETEDKILMAKMDEYQKQQPIENSSNGHQCRALLPSGRFCPRKDAVNCPFHGKIVPRDNDGLPLDPDLRERELQIKMQKQADEWKDPKYLKVLSLQLKKDLQMDIKKRKRKNSDNNLIDLKRLNSTPKRRIQSKLKILNK